MPVQELKRGAIPSPRSALAAARPHLVTVGAPLTFLTKPQRISMWGNDTHGDCVTAEEAFAKTCNSPEIFISDDDVMTWATRHGVLEGANLVEVMGWMHNDGFAEGSAVVYDDGPYVSVDWTNAAILQSAISLGPVKLGVAADQIESAYWANGGHTGWFGLGFHPDGNEDHCVALCGYGSITWLAQQLGVPTPVGVDGTQPGYALFTWNSIGIIDVPSMIAVTQEAWLRQPTTVTVETGSWHDWETLGGVLTSGPAVSSWASGRLDIFARGGGDNELWHKWFSNGFSDWESLDGDLTSDPTAVSWADGRIDVFARGTDNALIHKWYSNGWNDWENLGGVLTSGPTVASWASGRLDIFARGTDNALVHKWFSNGFSDWESLGGDLTSDPTAVSWADGRIDVFARGTDNALIHKWYSNGWNDWENLGGVLTSGPDGRSWASGRLDIFARGTDNALVHKWFSNGFSDWENLGGDLTSDPTAVSWADGRIDVFARGTDNALIHKWFG